MASRRTTYDKLQRERAKKAKAAMKRERRFDRGQGGDENEPAVVSNDTQDDLLSQLTIANARFEREEIDFEEFEEIKTELLERLAALPID
jgi:hypothetical protein